MKDVGMRHKKACVVELSHFGMQIADVGLQKK